ncbi:MAG TPA: hypothetical protein VNK04_26110 [Gemmataceae bacterium]|nr:hypothetical protein [Gemmataceae bacterium]
MRWPSIGKRRFLIGAAGVAVMLLAGVVWLGRVPLLTWYYLHQLARAGGAERDAWAERIAGLGGAAVPGLLHLLEQQDSRVCGNARAALARLTERWQPDDPRWADLADRLAEAYPQQRVAGRECTLQQMAEWLRFDPARPPEGMQSAAGRILAEVVRGDDREVEGAALELAAALLASLPPPEQAVAICRELARRGLSSAEAENRVRAIRLTLYRGMNLRPQVTPLLSDLRPEVRRAAMLAVGPAPEAIATDNLLPWLHDPDPDVRQLCEASLLARDDFRPEHLPLARLITSPQAAVRLQVLAYLQKDTSLEPGAWLRRLSHDPAPEVRAAAVRAAASQTMVDLSELIRERAQNDPSPTVSQLAWYYLRNSQKE